MTENRVSAQVATPWRLATEKRPAEELYDLAKDPEQLVNVADRAELRKIREEMRNELDAWLSKAGDPRMGREAAKFDGYPYLGGRAKKP